MRAILLGLLLALGPVLGHGLVVSPNVLAQCSLGAGTVVQLTGTPHLFVADDQGVLHWAGDTRALAGRTPNWSQRCEVSLETLRLMRRGDPWLSAGLPKIGDPVYLAKWEEGESAPTLLHIQSLADLELFGITATNYQTFVMDQVQWQQRFGFAIGSLQVGPLASAASFSWSEADRATYTQLLGQIRNLESATLYRTHQARGDAALVLPAIADCERQGLASFERNRNAGVALGITQDCLATVGAATVAVLTPPAPTNVRVLVLGPNQLRVSWDDMPGETGYRIYGGEQKAPALALVAAVPADTTLYEVVGRTPETSYCYSVTAFSAAGESPAAGPVCATTASLLSPAVTPVGPGGTIANAPTAPTSLRLTPFQAAGIRLDWSDTSTTEDGFRIIRAGQTLAAVGANVTSFVDTTYIASSTGCYVVVAFNASGEAPSAPACPGVASTVAPAAPSRLRLVVLFDGSGIVLGWIDNSNNEDGFRVLRRGQVIASVGPNVTTYTDLNLDYSTQNCYAVVAFNGAGEAATPQVCPGDP